MRIERFARATPRRCGRIVACAVLATALAACTVGPELQRPDVKAPDAWSAAGTRAFDETLPSRATTGPVDGRQWWLVFGDPVLDRLIDRAAAQNLDLQQATLRIAQARAQREGVAGQAYPNVEGSGIAGRSRMSENGIGKALAGSSSSGSGSSGGGSGASGSSGGGAAQSSAPPSTFNLFQAGFDATWELDLFGKVRRSVQAADADVRAADAARAGALVSLAAEIARDYLSLRGSERQRDIALADLATAMRVQALVSSRNRSGLAPSSDVSAQDAQVDAARAQLPPLEQSIGQSTNRLALLLALPPGGVADALGPVTQAKLPPDVPVGMAGDLLRRRPDVRQREAELDSATARIGVAKASLFPSVRLGLTGGLQSIEASSLFDWSSRFVLGGAQLSVPIFEGGRLQAQVRVADLQAQQAVLAYRQTVLSAFHDVDNALIAYAAEQRRLGSLQQQLEQARRSRALAEARYRSGLAGFIDVLDATRREHDAEEALDRSTVDASTDLVALFKALGGGWDDTAVAAR